MKTLAKIQQDKKLGGVCSGLAYMMGVPTWAVRMVWALGVLLGCGFPVAAYLLLWVFMPKWYIDPPDYLTRTQQCFEGPDVTGPAVAPGSPHQEP